MRVWMVGQIKTSKRVQENCIDLKGWKYCSNTYPFFVFNPVPTAVPPCASCSNDVSSVRTPDREELLFLFLSFIFYIIFYSWLGVLHMKHLGDNKDGLQTWYMRGRVHMTLSIPYFTCKHRAYTFMSKNLHDSKNKQANGWEYKLTCVV